MPVVCARLFTGPVKEAAAAAESRGTTRNRLCGGGTALENILELARICKTD